MKTRKTVDVWRIIGFGSYGKEVIDTFYSHKEARAMLIEYQSAFNGSMGCLVIKSGRDPK